MNLRTRIAHALAGPEIDRRIAEAVTAQDADERQWRALSATVKDVSAYDLRANQEDAMEAYRSNPLAFRIVELTTSYVLGKGIVLDVRPRSVATFVEKFWNHKLNHMDARLHQMLTELILTGDLFITFHTNAYDGMTYVRIVPSSLIDEIETDPQDIEQERRFHQIASTNPQIGTTGTGERWWTSDEMSHYTINRVVGATRGQGDLVPILPWLRRYKDWLTDRVIINKYKSAFLWDVTIQGATATTIAAKRAELSSPPTPGTIMVHNEAETWAAVQPDIKADDAQADGKAIRLAIGAGAGVPLHFLAEGMDVNRATSQEMGEPTRRHYEKRQLIIGHIIRDIIDEAITRATKAGKMEPRSRPHTLEITYPDLTNADNLSSAQALNQAIQAIAQAVDRGWITGDTARTWLYKMAQEQPPAPDEPMPTPPPPPAQPTATPTPEPPA